MSIRRFLRSTKCGESKGKIKHIMWFVTLTFILVIDKKSMSKLEKDTGWNETLVLWEEEQYVILV